MVGSAAAESESRRGLLNNLSTDTDHKVFSNACGSKYLIRVIASQATASNRGYWEQRSTEKDHAVVERCCGENEGMVLIEEAEIASRRGKFVM